MSSLRRLYNTYDTLLATSMATLIAPPLHYPPHVATELDGIGNNKSYDIAL
jgi:hypothetical protein